MLDVMNVGVSFGGVHALQAVSFTAAGHHITSVVGPNGAGKTTLFNIVSGFQKPGTGSVIFANQQMIGLRPSQIASAGLVRTFQKTEVFKGLTVERAVEIGTVCGRDFALWRTLWPGAIGKARVIARQESNAVLAACGLAQVAEKSCGALSYGEQRILEIALALAARPRLLMLDEPSLGLAPKIVRDVFHILTDLRKTGVSILLVEQNARAALEVADYAYVMELGAITTQGSPEEISRDPRLVESYLGLGGNEY